MKIIELEPFTLETFDKENQKHLLFLKEVVEQNKKNHYVPNIESRMNREINTRQFPFEQGYFVKKEDNLVGYLWLGGMRNDTIYLEYLIEEANRRKGYGKAILESMTDYLFENYNIESIYLDVDRSNFVSQKTAESAGYQLEEIADNGKLLFVKSNLNYIDKRKRGR